MAKLFPDHQQFVDDKKGETVGITQVTLVSTADHVIIPSMIDAALLHTAKDTSDPTFYISDGGDSFSIDGGSACDKHMIVSRHVQHHINFVAND